MNFMKNYYVMNAQSQMLWRDCEQGCRDWIAQQTKSWKSYGMKPPVYRLFYDSGREPKETFNQE
jgi:hypothetical protein